MRIGAGLDTGGTLDDVVARAKDMAGAGITSLWSSQIFGWDTLSVLAIVGREVPDVELGTAVVPIQPRHPVVLAAQALTVQGATGGRLVLGIGLSHQVVMESVFGIPWDRPARFMEEYLQALVPLVRGEQGTFQGQMIRATTFGPLETKGAEPPPVLVAALGERMLDIAGRLADGTVTWMTGPRTVEGHIVPRINEAAASAGRLKPRVVMSIPVCVTTDVDAAKERAAKVFAIYGQLPSYRAMLDREGASGPPDLAVVGTEEQVASGIKSLASTGATDVVATIFGSREEVALTTRLVGSLSKDQAS